MVCKYAHDSERGKVMRLIDADKMIDELKAFNNSDIATKKDKETAGRIAIYIEAVAQAHAVDVVTWKDFKDFLDDNSKRFDSLDAFQLMVVDKMMERWESLARKVELLERKLDTLMRVEDHEHEAIDDKLNTINNYRVTQGDINWLIKELKEGKRWSDNETD